MSQRISRGAILLDDELYFCKIGDIFTGAELPARMREANLENLSYEALVDDTDSHHGGMHSSFKGYSKVRNGVPWQTMLEGFGGNGYGTTETAVPTAQTKMFAASYQCDPDLTTGDLADTGSTTTRVISKGTGDFSLTSAKAIGLALFTVVIGGYTEYQFAPYYWNSPNLELLMALDAIPAVDSEIFAGANLRFLQDWAAGALPRSLAIKYLSTELQNGLVKGAVTSFSMGDTGPSETPRIAWNAFGVHHDQDFAEDYPNVADPPNVLPGWELSLAAAGSTVREKLAAPRISWPEFTSWVLDEDGNARDLDNGYPIGGDNWSRALAPAGFHVICRQSEVPPAACTSSTFEAMSHSQDPGDEIQALSSIGRAPGRMACRYLHRARVQNHNKFRNHNQLLMQEFDIIPVDKLSAGSATNAFYQPDIFNQS